MAYWLMKSEPDVFSIDGDETALCATLLATAHNVEPGVKRT